MIVNETFTRSEDLIESPIRDCQGDNEKERSKKDDSLRIASRDPFKGNDTVRKSLCKAVPEIELQSPI